MAVPALSLCPPVAEPVPGYFLPQRIAEDEQPRAAETPEAQRDPKNDANTHQRQLMQQSISRQALATLVNREQQPLG